MSSILASILLAQSRPLVLVSVIIISLLLVGCKQDSTTQAPVSTIPSELVGTWTAVAAFVGGRPALLSTALDWRSGTVRATFGFTASGEVTYTEYSSTDAPLQVTTGTIAVEGSTLTIRMLTDNGRPINPPKELTTAWSIAGNQLSLTWTDAHGTVTLQLTK
jgi:hypothetical protein